MLDGHRPRWFRERRLLRFFGIAMAALVLVSTALRSTAARATTALQHSDAAVVQGTIRDAAGKPVGEAFVIAVEARAPSKQDVVITAADGTFCFPALSPGSYTLWAQKSGAPSSTPAKLLLANGDHKRMDLVLGPTDQMSFSDAPGFTVAGVTDWTAVGGHGSDSILRTSEDLARETLALKAQGAGHHTSDSTTQTESEGKLRAALAAAPGSFVANHELGDFYLQAGRYRESLPLLKAASEIDPANDGNERDLALAYKETGDFSQARVHIQNLLKHKNDADLHRTAGELDEKLDDPLAAVKEYQQAVSLDPSEQNYFIWGAELLQHRAIWQAAEVFRNGVKAHPKSARLLTALGTALFSGAVYDEAARSLCDASDLDPANPEPYIFMGKIEMAAPAPLPCVEPKLARFVQEMPDSSLANYLYAMALSKRGGTSTNQPVSDQVETLLSKAVSLDPKCFDGYLQLGILAASQRNYEKAIQLYTKAIEVGPQLGEAHYRLGVAYERLGEQEKAKQEFLLHDEIEKRQAAVVERERREIKQFVVVQGQPAASISQ